MNHNRIRIAYLINQCEIIEQLVEEGYVNIHGSDIVGRMGYDFKLMGPSQQSAIFNDLRSSLGRKIRNLLEDRNRADDFRALPMDARFFRNWPKSNRGGPSIMEIEHTIQRSWDKLNKQSRSPMKETWEDFFHKQVRCCVAGATRAAGLRIIKGDAQRDPFFLAYEMRRAHTAQRNWLNIVNEMKDNVASGRLSQREADQMLNGGNVRLLRHNKDK